MWQRRLRKFERWLRLGLSDKEWYVCDKIPHCCDHTRRKAEKLPTSKIMENEKEVYKGCLALPASGKLLMKVTQTKKHRLIVTVFGIPEILATEVLLLIQSEQIRHRTTGNMGQLWQNQRRPGQNNHAGKLHQNRLGRRHQIHNHHQNELLPLRIRRSDPWGKSQVVGCIPVGRLPRWSLQHHKHPRGQRLVLLFGGGNFQRENLPLAGVRTLRSW